MQSSDYVIITGEKMAKNNLIMAIGILVQVFIIFTGASQAATITVPDDYPKIQWAINNAYPGDTILVKSGTYYENVDVNKQLILTGVDTGGGKPVVDGGWSYNAFWVSASGVTIERFIVKNGSHRGIGVISNNNIIRNNSISNNRDGIALENSANNNIIDNNIYSNIEGGIRLSKSIGNSIAGNTANNTINGSGIGLFQDSNSNIVVDNIAYNNHHHGLKSDSSINNIFENNILYHNDGSGIELFYSSNSSIKNNVMKSNEFGILLSNSDSNEIIGNEASNPEGFENNGIFISNSSNNKINNNNFSYNTGAGIAMDISNNNKISENILINNEAGVSINFSSNNTIYGNNASLNSINGIALHNYSNYNTLDSNIANYNGCGIELSDGSNYNTIFNNTVNLNNKWEGLFIRSSSYNILSGNTVNNNNWSGIGLKAGSNYNIILTNTLNSNKEGIRIDSSSNNTIHHNNIINNTNQAYDSDPTSNNWYNVTSLEGNYWSDYTGVDDGSGTGKHDFSGDHIGDTLIPHPSTGYDYYPYMYADGWMRPTIVVYTDKKGYSAGNKMYVGLDITNPGDARKAGLYIWIDLPGGGKFWVAKYSSVTLPAGLDYNKMPWEVITLPNIPPGNYAWHAVLLDPVVKETISESISPWTFSAAATTEAGSIKELDKVLQGVSEEADLLK